MFHTFSMALYHKWDVKNGFAINFFLTYFWRSRWCGCAWVASGTIYVIDHLTDNSFLLLFSDKQNSWKQGWRKHIKKVTRLYLYTIHSMNLPILYTTVSLSSPLLFTIVKTSLFPSAFPSHCRTTARIIFLYIHISSNDISPWQCWLPCCIVIGWKVK